MAIPRHPSTPAPPIPQRDLLWHLCRPGPGARERVAEGLLAEWDRLEGQPHVALAHVLPKLDRDGHDERMVTIYVLPVLAWAYLELGQADEAARVIGAAISTCAHWYIDAGMNTAGDVWGRCVLEADSGATRNRGTCVLRTGTPCCYLAEVSAFAMLGPIRCTHDAAAARRCLHA